jgi:hypothetical protein
MNSSVLFWFILFGGKYVGFSPWIHRILLVLIRLGGAGGGVHLHVFVISGFLIE